MGVVRVRTHQGELFLFFESEIFFSLGTLGIKLLEVVLLTLWGLQY